MTRSKIVRSAATRVRAHPGSLPRQLTLKFAGQLVKHLGLQMYSGAVPAVAELIANAWDADASTVEIKIPLGTPLTPASTIVVTDNGHGMSFEECDLEYLVVGRNRRKAEKNEMTKSGKRRLMAHKGIGKLAAFGIANVVTVRTRKNGRQTSFTMDYREIIEDAKFVQDYQPRDVSLRSTDKPDGTEIILTDISLDRAIPAAGFIASMARRFGVYSDTFQVVINGQPIEKAEAPWQFRYPETPGSLQDETLTGSLAIKWWFGFSRDPIPNEEARGISVIARGRLVQLPWFFGVSGGMHGQHGLQYLTGEVEADFLDEGEEDLVATDRGTVLWEHPKAAVLQEWGQGKIRELLNSWADRRAEVKLKRLREMPVFWPRIERFPRRERTEIQSAIGKLAAIETIEDARLEELVNFLLNAYENKNFMDVIRQLNAASPDAQAEVLGILAEWDVLEAIATAQVVRGRLEVITKFEQMISAGVREKPDMQDLLRDHPWLIEMTWQLIAHERRLDGLLHDHFDRSTAGARNRRRVDFFCLADQMRVIVVEVKRPGEDAGKEEIRQLEDYVDYLRDQEENTTDRSRPARSVHGYLVVGGLDAEGKRAAERMARDDMFVRTWDQLLRTAREGHRYVLEVAKKRAPADDPRIRALDDTRAARPPEGATPRRQRAPVRAAAGARRPRITVRTARAPRRHRA